MKVEHSVFQGVKYVDISEMPNTLSFVHQFTKTGKRKQLSLIHLRDATVAEAPDDTFVTLHLTDQPALDRCAMRANVKLDRETIKTIAEAMGFELLDKTTPLQQAVTA